MRALCQFQIILCALILLFSFLLPWKGLYLGGVILFMDYPFVGLMPLLSLVTLLSPVLGGGRVHYHGFYYRIIRSWDHVIRCCYLRRKGDDRNDPQSVYKYRSAPLQRNPLCTKQNNQFIAQVRSFFEIHQ